jgi:hypothetical protein
VLSMCDPATNNWMKKSQNMPVWPSIFVQFLLRLVIGIAKPNTCQRRV